MNCRLKSCNLSLKHVTIFAWTLPRHKFTRETGLSQCFVNLMEP